MRGIIFFCLPALLCTSLRAQRVYTIKADSVKITSNCDSGELILQNHTQNVPGFLFNTGNGRTIFKRGMQSLGGGVYLLGADTLNLANFWQKGGNAYGTTGVLGTTDNNHLDLYTNNTARARLTNTGNLLLGTTTDNGSNLLQVNGSIYTNYLTNFSPQSGSSGAVRLQWGSSDGSYISFYYQGYGSATGLRGFIGSAADNRRVLIYDQVGITFNQTPTVTIGAEGGEAKLTVTNPYGSIYDAFDVFHLDSSSNAIYDLSVNKHGNVIVGTTNDNGKKFSVNGSAFFDSSICLAGLSMDSTQTRVLVSDGSGNLYYRSASSLAADNLLRSSLAVNGPIKARKLTLTATDWPDYVFDSSYKLPALGEVEVFLRKAHHLPGIPSAAEVAKDSLDVGAGQAALLKKIEELTLYNISEQKQLESQDKEIRALKAELEEIKNLLKKDR